MAWRIGALLLVVAFIAHEATAQQCQPGWDFNPNGRTCYYFSADKKNWFSANQACSYMNADLAALETYQEIAYVKSLRVMRRINDKLWIGGTDADREGAWVWKNRNGAARTITAFDWHPREPNSEGGNQDCLALHGSKDNMQYDDEKCSRSAKYICEKPL